ncbi:MAG: hypothetical protein ACKV2T_36000 [Kofleriaceae bacterium]
MRIADVVAVVLVGAVVSTAAAAPRPHRGKVVRVERSRAADTPPRVCEIHTDGSGVCIGTEPAIGDVVMVMNDSGVVAETKITEATGFSTGGNQVCGALWNVKSDLLRGDLTNLTARNFGVVDAAIHPQKGRIVGKDQTPVSPGDASDAVIVAVDRDGDRTADIIVVQSNCDGLSPGGGGACLDSWARVKGRMVRVQQTNFATCGI